MTERREELESAVEFGNVLGFLSTEMLKDYAPHVEALQRYHSVFAGVMASLVILAEAGAMLEASTQALVEAAREEDGNAMA
jgi:hypothetical protein